MQTFGYIERTCSWRELLLFIQTYIYGIQTESFIIIKPENGLSLAKKQLISKISWFWSWKIYLAIAYIYNRVVLKCTFTFSFFITLFLFHTCCQHQYPQNHKFLGVVKKKKKKLPYEFFSTSKIKLSFFVHSWLLVTSISCIHRYFIELLK